MKKNIIYCLVILFAAFVVGCDNDDVDRNNSVFDSESLPKKNEFDLWLEDNFRVPYNIQIAYQFDYMDTDFSYNLTPATFDISTKFTQIIKYCWFECYDEVAGMHFTRETAPKQIYLIGSEGLDPATNTKVLATASGGLRVVLYELNLVKEINYESIIQYMHRMHHEFSHILDQKREKDLSFGAISEKDYVGDNWPDAYNKIEEYYKLGFVSEYASSEADEDFAEVYSIYLTTTDEEWENILTNATEFDSKGNVVSAYGREKIEQKLKMVSDYMEEAWNTNLRKLKESAQIRAVKAEDIEFISFKEFTN
ncbi:substrate import-associated zinc metallohydrolase lipoprotein [Dysgonomonas sp. Marseille-P4361]|uniref:substrate import-associated zinc metallohydrolase lipoprotein n=1 Tax=Dysgonomonas sp. Marseille-P4361 TaxID=2161820 RepID=UPI000D55A662|nr:substrate import-associated zinc metallohydrolase lipoprotein [Dysgonomonas sp. Marseille-P4361]